MNLESLSKHKLEDLRHTIILEMKKRYKKNQEPKYGSLNKGFLDDEAERIFRVVKKKKVLLLFKLMDGLGLRVGEAVSIPKENVDLSQRRLWIYSSKNSVPTLFFLHDEVYSLMLEYYEENKDLIARSAYWFPSGNPRNKTDHLSPNWLRNEMQVARKLAGLEMVYAHSEEARPRKLQRLTMHSFRHHFCRKVWVKTGDFYLTKKLSRHKNAEHLERYIHLEQEEIDQALVTVFNKT